jgi:hypothetical protein
MKATAVCGRLADTPAGRYWAVSGGHRQLPKLQRFSTGAGSSEDRFLYDYEWPDEVPVSRVRSAGFDDTLYLKAGVGEWLVRMAGALRPIVQQRGATFVAERSRDLLRQWCGQDVVEQYDQVGALREEISKLVTLSEHAIEKLREAGKSRQANKFARELAVITRRPPEPPAVMR